MGLSVYNPEEVVVVFAGITTLEGFPEGTFIEVKKDLNPFSSTRTSDGMHARVYHSDQSYSIYITLLSGSKSNDILTKAWLFEETAQRGKFPLFIKDFSGTDLFFSTTTWIEELPSLVKSNDWEQRTWVMKSSQGVINYGGNEEGSSTVTDLLNIASGALPILQDIFNG